MYRELKEEDIINKVGGRFKLSTLLQKRLVQLNAGSQALVDIHSSENMEIALQEVMQGKIFLDMSDEVQVVGGSPGEPGSDLDINPVGF